jgi:putative methionine-R-sulfoxide reductase with GAF domain
LKTYSAGRTLIAQIEKVLAENKPSFGRSPLDRVIELLSKGRHYSWLGIYLAVAENQQHLLGSSGEAGLHCTSAPETRSKMLVTMKIASREIGVLAAESEREYPFGSEDRVLLEKVADLLARRRWEKSDSEVRRTKYEVGFSICDCQLPNEKKQLKVRDLKPAFYFNTP